MAAVMTPAETSRQGHPKTDHSSRHDQQCHRPVRSAPAPVVRVTAAPAPTTRRVAPSPATYRRRRFAAALVVVGMLAMAGKAGAALGGASTPGTPPRGPSVVTEVVQPGDTLWSIAQRLAPGADPRPIVDQLQRARHGDELQPGEKIVWQR